VVIAKLRDLRDKKVKAKSAKKKPNPSNLKLELKPTTQAALRKRGVIYMGDLRLVNDDILDQVVEELIANGTPPLQVKPT